MNTPQPQDDKPLAPNARLSLRFLSRWQNYYRGDVATFPARMAIALVARGKAEAVNIVASENPPEGAQWALRPPGQHVSKGRIEDDF